VQPSDTPFFTSLSHQDIAISPDGQTIVFTEQDGSAAPALWLRRVDQLQATRVRGAEAAYNPFISPDNAWIGFVETGEQTVVKKVSMLGGPPTQLGIAAAQILGATWADDGSIILGQASGPLQIVGDAGGNPTPLTKLDASEGAQRWPSAIPGTKVVLFTSLAGEFTASTGGQIVALDRATHRVARLRISGVHPRYVPTGHVIYAMADGTLRAVRFDPTTLTVSGNPVPVLEGVGVKPSGAAQFDVAADGRLVYAGSSANQPTQRSLCWVDRSGKETAVPAPQRNYFYVRLSPDGTRVTADVRENEQNTWIWDLKRETLLRLTDKPGQFQYGLWTPDSQHVVVSVTTNGVNNLFQMRPDGTGQMEQVTDVAKDKLSPFPNAVTPDGTKVIFRAGVASNKNDLFVAPLTGTDHTAAKLLATEHDERNATISPDGKWMAFESDLSGRYEVYVRPYPNVDTAQFPLSVAGGLKPAWSPAGAEIFYLSDDGKMIAVPVDTTKGFVAGKPVALFDARPYFTGAVGRNYDVTRDGRRFFMIKNVAASAIAQVTPIVVVINWADELRGRLK
jgi:serine/threonine-protein kinase